MQLPSTILDSLRSVLRRIRRVQLSKGLLAVAAAFLICVVLVMAADWAFQVEAKWARVALSGLGLAAVAATAWRYLWVPLRHPISITSVARWVEIQHPEMQERISTALELSQRGDSASQGLLDRILTEAGQEAGKLDPRREISPKVVRKSLWAAGSGFAALALFFGLAPQIAKTLFIRALAPLADVGNAYAKTITLLTPNGQIVAGGEAFHVDAAYQSPKSQRAVIVLTYPDGTEVREQMMEDSAVETKDASSRGVRFRLPTQENEK
jgi:hypothetical protein